MYVKRLSLCYNLSLSKCLQTTVNSLHPLNRSRHIICEPLSCLLMTRISVKTLKDCQYHRKKINMNALFEKKEENFTALHGRSHLGFYGNSFNYVILHEINQQVNTYKFKNHFKLVYTPILNPEITFYRVPKAM